MTTTVKVEAHCASNKEVIITISNTNAEDKETVIQNGETFQDVVYDFKEISVKEVLKAE